MPTAWISSKYCYTITVWKPYDVCTWIWCCQHDAECICESVPVIPKTAGDLFFFPFTTYRQMWLRNHKLMRYFSRNILISSEWDRVVQCHVVEGNATQQWMAPKTCLIFQVLTLCVVILYRAWAFTIRQLHWINATVMETYVSYMLL